MAEMRATAQQKRFRMKALEVAQAKEALNLFSQEVYAITSSLTLHLPRVLVVHAKCLHLSISDCRGWNESIHRLQRHLLDKNNGCLPTRPAFQSQAEELEISSEEEDSNMVVLVLPRQILQRTMLRI
mmetsp:Transcript_17742/g.42749  ORF Transcript_17742/g.42749 Transcript_17742/m.42749 type:complete len:127 (+) Transcript_17742:878-1258(+)